MRIWKNLWNDESGAVATEYVILVGLIAIGLIGAITIFRNQLFAVIKYISEKFKDPASTTTTSQTTVADKDKGNW